MKQIWKYSLEVVDVQRVLMPASSKLLTVQYQHDGPKLWAIVDPKESDACHREFVIIGTGNATPRDIDALAYVATFQMREGALVFHVFERTS